ncbi:RsiV family protein [Pedobacter alpinus]|uniref:RsiV family protein n=1 Tax=Pedobacter alpinus TaxID=1590643 RepID=A0ABW5TVL2_9SPHI
MKYFFILLFSISFTACQNTNKNTDKGSANSTQNNDSLFYEIIDFEKVPADLKDKPDSLKIAYVKASYPKFNDNEISLNLWIKKRLASQPMAEKPSLNLETAAINFLKEFEDYRKEFPESAAGYAWDQDFTVFKQDSQQINFIYTTYAYTAGAHGLATILYLNWDKKLQQEIKLDDLLIADYNNKLTAIAEKIFRKDEGLTETEPLERYFFENQKFALNQNFLITNEGLKFLYNPYEIKSYAEGTTELLIPYSAIKDLIKPNSIISKYTN